MVGRFRQAHETATGEWFPPPLEDTVRNQIAGKLEDAFFGHFRYKPSKGEVNSWRNSLRAIAQVFQASDLMDHGVILEYQLPLTSRRLDCLVCGRNDEGSDGAVIVELKQWEKCSRRLNPETKARWPSKKGVQPQRSAEAFAAWRCKLRLTVAPEQARSRKSPLLPLPS